MPEDSDIEGIRQDSNDEENISFTRKKKLTKRNAVIDSDSDGVADEYVQPQNQDSESSTESAVESGDAIKNPDQNSSISKRIRVQQSDSSDSEACDNHKNHTRKSPKQNSSISKRVQELECDSSDSEASDSHIRKNHKQTSSVAKKVQMVKSDHSDNSKAADSQGMDSSSDDENLKSVKSADFHSSDHNGDSNVLDMNENSPASVSVSPTYEKKSSESILSTKPVRISNPDLFDAEMDSDSGSDQPQHSDGEQTGSRHSSGSESNEPNQLSAALKRRLAKGAAKKPKQASRTGGQPNVRKPTKDDVRELHSETQRLVRTAPVRLPYHQPEKKSVSDFLARTALRRQQLLGNTASSCPARPTWKQALQTLPNAATVMGSLLPNNASQSLPMESKVLPAISSHQCLPSKRTVDTMSDVEPDDLPSLESIFAPSTVTDFEKEKVFLSSDRNEDAIEICAAAAALSVECSKLEVVEKNASDVNVGIDPVIEGHSSLLVAGSCSEEANVGCLDALNPNPSSQQSTIARDTDECDTGVNVDKFSSVASNNSLVPMDVAVVGDALTVVATVPEANSISSNNLHESVDSQMVGSRKLMRVVDNIPTPHLSGSFGEIVELDDGDNNVESMKESCNPGVEKFKERWITHARTGHVANKKKSRTMEISTVHKEKVSESREELLLKSFTYTIDGDDENVDPALSKPGAKLGLLKAKLSEQMRTKRDQGLARRYELFGERYGEASGSGYEAKRLEEDAIVRGDEEAELTDQTDTDDETDEESELDEEERVVRTQRKRNEFVDEEAEESDDGDDELGDEDESMAEDGSDDEAAGAAESDQETGDDQVRRPRPNRIASDSEDDLLNEENSEESLCLHLEPDDDDEDDNVQDQANVGEKLQTSQSKRSSLQRANTFEVFDEDANTESPTVSQKSNGLDDLDMKDRPYLQLLTVAGNALPTTELPETQTKLDDTIASVASLVKETSATSVDSTFDILGSMIPCGQLQQNRKLTTPFSPGRKTPELFTPHSKSSTANSLRNKPTTSVDESNVDVGTKSSTPLHFISSLQAEDSFHLALENDTETQPVSNRAGNWLRRQSLLRGSSNNLDSILLESQDNNRDDDELLMLCSGTFSAEFPAGSVPAAASERKSAAKSLFNLESQQSDTNEELLDLCSGQFTGAATSAVRWVDGSHSSVSTPEPSAANGNNLVDKLSKKLTKLAEAQQASSEVFGRHSTPLRKKSKKRKAVIEDDDEIDVNVQVSNDLFADDTSEHDNELDSVSSEGLQGESADEDSLVEQENLKFSGFIEGNKRGKIRRDFVEDEAELSGSEYDSDENLDLDEKDDTMEQEEGDNDDVGTEEELRNQVHRVHMKNVLDEDDREIRLLQEQFLTDGDLHSDGFGRMKRFRWNNADGEDDDGQNASLNENGYEEEDDGEREAAWRMERLEREKFLEEHKKVKRGNEDEDGDSQLIRLGKSAVVSHNSANSTPQQITPKPHAQPHLRHQVHSGTPASAAGIFKVPSSNQRLSHGSFLCRKKEDLAKITDLVKPATNLNGPRSSRNFVFAPVSPDEKSKPAPKQKAPQMVQRSTSLTPTVKRPRLDRSCSAPVTTSKLALLEQRV